MNSWSIYLLVSGTRTYIGSTTDVQRRLRQHNGEIAGGARSTKGRKWRIYSYVSNFPNRSSACRWEKLVKNRARGLHHRQIAMLGLVYGLCPYSKTRRMDYEVPNHLMMELIGEFK